MLCVPTALHIAEAVLNSIALTGAILEDSGRIVAVNAAWRQFAAANGLAQRDAGMGVNYLDICDRAGGDGQDEARQVAQ